jgi:DNA-binding transcriptional ArsR family regulator
MEVSNAGGAAQPSAEAWPSRVRGESTRSRILRYLEESGRPVRVAAIAAHLGLNHTGVRRHLAALRDAGLVVEERAAPGVPGRPPLEYRASRKDAVASAGTAVYEELAVLVLRLRRDGGSPRAAGVEEGRRAVSGDPALRSGAQPGGSGCGQGRLGVIPDCRIGPKGAT